MKSGNSLSVFSFFLPKPLSVNVGYVPACGGRREPWVSSSITLLCSFETGSLPEPEIHLFSEADNQQTPVTLRPQPANGLGLWVPQGPGLARVGARIWIWPFTLVCHVLSSPIFVFETVPSCSPVWPRTPEPLASASQCWDFTCAPCLAIQYLHF